MTPEPDEDAALSQSLRASRQLHDAPETVIQRALQIFQTRAAPLATAAAAAPASGLLKRLAATLSFDSAGLSAVAAGLRATASSSAATRQLLYATEGRDVDLRLTTTDDGASFVVSGQVLGPDVSGVAVLSWAGGEATAAWNELAEFRFDPVGPGLCQLTLRADGWELLLPPLHLRQGD